MGDKNSVKNKIKKVPMSTHDDNEIEIDKEEQKIEDHE